MTVVHFFPLLIGGILLITGSIQHFFPPKKINALYGYRSKRSMKNNENWNIAQSFSAKQLLRIGLVQILLSPVGYLIGIQEDQQVWMYMVTMILGFIILIIRTERLLKKNENV
jgi:uncharacterized membrane protein